MQILSFSLGLNVFKRSLDSEKSGNLVSIIRYEKYQCMFFMANFRKK